MWNMRLSSEWLLVSRGAGWKWIIWVAWTFWTLHVWVSNWRWLRYVLGWERLHVYKIWIKLQKWRWSMRHRNRSGICHYRNLIVLICVTSTLELRNQVCLILTSKALIKRRLFPKIHVNLCISRVPAMTCHQMCMRFYNIYLEKLLTIEVSIWVCALSLLLWKVLWWKILRLLNLNN